MTENKNLNSFAGPKKFGNKGGPQNNGGNTSGQKSYKKKGGRSNFPPRNIPNNYDVDFSLRTEKKGISKIEGDKIRVLTLGGFEEVGRNMFAVESKDSIYIFDMGFQFTNEDESPGVDYTLPNISHLAENKHKIKAVIITHGHLDHIGGIPFLMAKIGNPPIYTRKLTALLIKKRMEEFPGLPTLKINLVEPGDQIKIGDHSFEFFNVTHSIPDSMGISMKTVHGNIVISGDLKLAHLNEVPIESEQKTWAKVGSEKNVFMISDSTNCENPGWSIQEPAIHENVKNYIRDAKSRIIIASFASQFERMMSFIAAAEDLGKKIVLDGRSTKTNMEIAQLAEYYTPKKDTIIDVKDIDNYPSNRIVIVCTGSQGEEFAALPRMARGDHKFVKLNHRDTVILSSSVIPGNEISVRLLKDKLMRHDVNLIHYKTSDVHSTGHGNAEELA
jgi:ribonuclease J